MTDPIRRRQFLAGSLAAAAATTAAAHLAQAADKNTAGKKPAAEFYELRIYRCVGAEKQSQTEQYIEHALAPAMRRLGARQVGVFTETPEANADASDASVYMLIVYPTLEVLGNRNAALADDDVYQKAAAEFFAIPKKDPAYTRIESRLMKAFAGMPVTEPPATSKTGAARIFELRIYESHNEDKARLKVEMFNEGEIDVMREVKLGPVFFGETLISSDAPNLTYMLSGDNLESHQEHWKAFIDHPEWNRMKKLKRYADTVSKITKIMLAPTKYSDL